MVRLDHDAFLTRLSDMYRETRDSGAVCITLKKVTRGDLSKGKVKGTVPELDAAVEESACLVRATVNGGTREGSRLAASGKGARKAKVKISTLVLGKDQDKFHGSLATLNKAQMDRLKKRQKKKKKTKAQQQTK